MNKTETMHTSNLTISSDWASRSKHLKKEFPELTDADLLFETGKEKELYMRIAVRLNKNEEDVISIIKKGRLERI